MKSLNSVPLCNPMDCSLPCSSVHGILQARILEWAAISFSRGSSQPRDWTRVSHIAGRHFTLWAWRVFKHKYIFKYTHIYTCICICIYNALHILNIKLTLMLLCQPFFQGSMKHSSFAHFSQVSFPKVVLARQSVVPSPITDVIFTIIVLVTKQEPFWQKHSNQIRKGLF